MKTRHPLPVLMGLMMLLWATAIVSCGTDEPDYLVDYYLHIQSQVKLNLTEDDESQGTSSTMPSSVLSTTIVKMRNTLKDTYPAPTLKGDDPGVLTACDNIYRNYKTAYHRYERNTVCTVILYKIWLDDEVVVRSKCLTTYHFGVIDENINPPGQ